MAQANPTTPITMVNLDLIEDQRVRDVIRNLVRQIESVYGQASNVMNMNLARTVSAAGPNPPTVADGESIVWIRTDVTPATPYIVSRTGGTLYLWQAAQTMAVPGSTPGGGGGTPPPASAPVVQSFSPLTGPVSTSVAITGTGFTGASSVLINGVSMTFQVINDTRINATIPNGASTGPIKVVTPAGSGTSSTSFQVTGTVSSGPPAGAGLTIAGSSINTFHSIGLYWRPTDGNGASVTPLANPAFPNQGPAVAIRYAKITDTAWKRGHDLWYDSRNTDVNTSYGLGYGRPPEARGSIVECDTGTQYVVQFGLYDAQGNITWVRENRPITWSELGQAIPQGGYGPVEGPNKITTLKPGQVQFGGGRTNFATGAHVCDQSGTPGAWTVYDLTGLTAQAPNQSAQYPVILNGAYMILRGLKCVGGESSIYVQPGSHDILIEKCELTDWCIPNPGSIKTFTLDNVTGGTVWTRGEDEASAILIPHPSFGDSSQTKRLIIQRNSFHNPRYGNTSWDTEHPHGPSPMTFYPNGGNNVVRYNQCFNTTDGTLGGPPDYGHFFCDGLVNGGDNETLAGIGPDTDIYKNLIQQTMDDGCEIDGGGRNTRVWRNYIDLSSCGISSTACFIGPAYIWRNVHNRSRKLYKEVWGNESDRLQMLKIGGLASSDGSNLQNGGRRYIYHNTSLQYPSNSQPGAAANTVLGNRQFGTGTGGAGNEIQNTVFRNNVGLCERGQFIDTSSGVLNSDFAYDLTNNSFGVTDSNGLTANPAFQTGNGPLALYTGKYRLSPGPGHGDALPLFNFNDKYASPDRGAHQDGTVDMDFGINATGA